MFFICLMICACHRKTDAPDPKSKTGIEVSSKNSAPQRPTAQAQTAPQSTPDSAALQPVIAAPEPKSKAAIFTSRPAYKAFVGRLYQYRPVVSASTRPPGLASASSGDKKLEPHGGPTSALPQLKLINGPDSMVIRDGTLSWTPVKAGKYPIVLEAMGDGDASGRPLRQAFVVAVEKVLNVILKPLPASVNLGDTVTFDLRGSAIPEWALGDVTVNFDFDGDGNWDSGPLPWASAMAQRKSYTRIGRYHPKLQVAYGKAESAVMEGALNVVGSVVAVLQLKPDTVEPGGMVSVDVSGSKGDGRLSFNLDLDGDGKSDWVDSLSSHAQVKAPPSGVYQAKLTVRNTMNQEAVTRAMLRVNAKAILEMKIKNPKENMRAPVEIKAHAVDADDTLRRARINFTGDSSGWEMRASPPDSQISPRDWLLRFKHSYGKTGKFLVTVCVTSGDGRETCASHEVEIFNAPPVCRPGPDLKATVGRPIAIEGDGEDPDGKIVKWEWDLDHDGKYDLVSSENGKFQFTFAKAGVFPLTLRVTSADGVTATGVRKIEVRKKW